MFVILCPFNRKNSSNGLPIGANTGRMVDALPKGLRKFVFSGIPEIAVRYSTLCSSSIGVAEVSTNVCDG